jgi:hypothetical protein
MIHVARILPFMNHRLIGLWASANIKFYGKMGNKISNIAADVFLSRTSSPYFLKEKGLYLPIESGDQEIYHKTSEVLDAFMLDGAGQNARHAIVQEYNDPWIVVRLLAKAGLVNEQEARATMQTTFPRYTTWMGLRNVAKGLGLEFHFATEAEMTLHMLTIAAYGSYHGQQGWRRWNRVLMEGAWPRLRGYRKAYARLVYTVVVSLFAAVELGYVNTGVTALMIELVKTLVGGGYGGGAWKVRKCHSLKDKKVRIAAVKGADNSKAGKVEVEEKVPIQRTVPSMS